MFHDGPPCVNDPFDVHDHPTTRQDDKNKYLQRPRISYGHDTCLIHQGVTEGRLCQPNKLAQTPHEHVNSVDGIDSQKDHVAVKRSETAKPRTQDGQHEFG